MLICLNLTFTYLIYFLSLAAEEYRSRVILLHSAFRLRPFVVHSIFLQLYLHNIRHAYV